MPQFPQRVICMTEESVEWLYRLGAEDKIVGVSTYAVRPEEVKNKTVISSFTHANLKKIISLKPDLILGFSDIQKEIARDLIGAGLNVFITNQRSLDEILATLQMIAALVGKSEEAKPWLNQFKTQLLERRARQWKRRPRVYIEEWDEPLITGIRWFSELVELSGGEPIFKEKSEGSLAKDRFVTLDEIAAANPEKILACWCGKKVDIQQIKSRPELSQVDAIKNNQIYDCPPEIFLQPGPALFFDGFDLCEKMLGAVRV